MNTMIVFDAQHRPGTPTQRIAPAALAAHRKRLAREQRPRRVRYVTVGLLEKLDLLAGINPGYMVSIENMVTEMIRLEAVERGAR